MAKTCPDCAEKIQDDARVCRYCGYRFSPPPDEEPGQDDARLGAGGVAGLGGPESADASRKSIAEASTEPSRKRRWPWVVVFLLALALIGAGIAEAVHLNSQVHPKAGSYTDQALDPSLPVGGLSSDAVPVAVANESLANFEAVGYRILADAEERGVIDSFRAVTPTGQWIEQFRLDDEDFVLNFTRGHKEYVIEYPVSRLADEERLADIAGEHGFNTISEKGREEFDEIVEQSEGLLELVDEIQLTEGVPDSSIHEIAVAVKERWNRWLETYEGEQEDLDLLAQAHIAVAGDAEELASYPTEERLDAYYVSVEELEQAIQVYNRNVKAERSS